MNTHNHHVSTQHNSREQQHNKECNYANDYYGDRQCKPCQTPK